MRSSEDPDLHPSDPSGPRGPRVRPVGAGPQERSGYPRASPKGQPTDIGEVTELLQQLIRNRCVNEGTPSSGNEMRSVETLEAYFSGTGAAMQRYEPAPGRGNLVLRIEGTDRSASALCLMGHLDVVPASAEGWQRDPFGGELVDGEVWGRGAIDMLGVTASMAVATRRLLRDGWRPRGTLVYLGVADEEALGTYGAQWMVEHEWDAILCDHVVTEGGGVRLPLAGRGGPKIALAVGEKGTYWLRLAVRGTPGHGSMPYRSDNAVVKAAQVVDRIARYRPPARIHGTWRAFVQASGLPALQQAVLLRPATLELALPRLPLGVARMIHASTHTTFSPNVMHGGVKTNVIADSAEVVVDIRTLPGVGGPEVRAMLAEALGDLWPEVDLTVGSDDPASASPPDTRLSRVLSSVTARLQPGAVTVPFLIVGATDARFFRRKGVTAYGYGLLGERIPFDEFARLFHGRNERIDQTSLRLMVDLWEGTARELLA